MSRWYEHKVPPLIIGLTVVALMWILACAVPSAQRWPRGVWPLALGLALAGALIVLAGVLAFRRVRTTVNPLTPTQASALVTSGIYRVTRNPMYLGMLLVLAGWGAWLGNAAALLGLPLFVWLLNMLQIKPEERALRERFGRDFEQYEKRVRRWI